MEVPFIPPSIKPVAARIRGIIPETFKKFGVAVEVDTGSLLFPYKDRRNKQVKAYKVRLQPFAPNPDKVMPWLGSYKNTSLFGEASVSSKALILCFGEFDTMSAHQMTGYAAMCPLNDDAAVSHVNGNLQSLETFQVIYIIPDNDKSGKEALDALLGILDLSLVKVVTLPQDVKDVNDMLVQDRVEEFKKCLWAATPPQLTFIRSQAEVTERTLKLMSNPHAFIGYPTGWAEYDEIAGGVRPGEIVTVGAKTSMGKSSFVRALSYRLSEQGVLFCGYEGRQEIDNLSFASLHFQKDLKNLMRYGSQAEAMDLVEAWGKVSNIDWVDTSVYDLKAFLRSLKQAIRMRGYKVIVLDHLHFLVNAMSSQNERTAIDNFMLQIHEAVVELDVALIMVSHLSRNKNAKGEEIQTFNISDFSGSSGIEKYSDVCIGLFGERYDPNVNFKIEKNRLLGKRGEFNLEYQAYGDYL